MQLVNTNLRKIGVFYDGNYFLHVSNYYNYTHHRKSRISISGLHEFIKHKVASLEEIDHRLCHIVDAHYFRGRISAQEAQEREGLLYYDRVFEDILMSESVVTHYLPIKTLTSGYKQEKGIDVWMALEAYEIALLKKLDLVVIISSDGDYVHLVRKLAAMGVSVMVLSWDFEFTNSDGGKIITKTSVDLIKECTYHVPMHEVIDELLRTDDTFGVKLFSKVASYKTPNFNTGVPIDLSRKTGVICSLKSGYGFIKFPPNNLFFHHSSLLNSDFEGIAEGDTVSYVIDRNDKGDYIAIDVMLDQKGNGVYMGSEIEKSEFLNLNNDNWEYDTDL